MVEYRHESSADTGSTAWVCDGQRRHRDLRHRPRPAAAALPDRHPRHRRHRRGLHRVPAQGVGRRAQPDRRPHLRSQFIAPGPAATLPALEWSPAGRVLFPAVRRTDRLGRPWWRLCDGAVPCLRHRLRVLPGAVCGNAGRDDPRLHRAHPVDDLAGRGSRARDPVVGCDGADCRERLRGRSHRQGLPADGRLHRGDPGDRRPRGLLRHCQGARARGPYAHRIAARPARPCLGIG